jgi:hypothetical protein
LRNRLVLKLRSPFDGFVVHSRGHNVPKLIIFLKAKYGFRSPPKLFIIMFTALHHYPAESVPVQFVQEA